MSAKRNINNAKFLNARYSELNMLVLGRNLTDKKVSLYIVPIAGKDPITDISKGAYSPFVTADNYVRTSDGVVNSSLKADASEPNAKFTLNLKTDLNASQTTSAYGIPTNLVEAMVVGSVFTHGSDKVEVVGTNGLILKNGSKPTRCEIGNEFKYLFEYENSKIKDGQAIDDNGRQIFKTNNFRAKPDMEVKSIAFELYTIYDANVTPSVLYPYCYTGDIKESENDTANTMTAEFTKCGETWVSNNSLLYNAKESFAVTDIGKHCLEVDYIVYSATLPTDFGVAGQKIAQVHPTTGAVTIHTTNALAWTLANTGTFLVGARVSAPRLVTGLTLATATVQKTFVALKAVDATNGGTASNFAYDTTGAVKNFICKSFILNRDTEQFDAFDSTGSAC